MWHRLGANMYFNLGLVRRPLIETLSPGMPFIEDRFSFSHLHIWIDIRR